MMPYRPPQPARPRQLEHQHDADQPEALERDPRRSEMAFVNRLPRLSNALFVVQTQKVFARTRARGILLQQPSC